jgi:hypothetical protein
MATGSIKVYPWRIVSFLMGTAAGAISAYGAYEYAIKLEGSITYLALAAPLVAIAVATIPPKAISYWAAGDTALALFTWVALIPCAVFLFFTAAERVHLAKAGAEAERNARVLTAMRAAEAYKEARSKLTPELQRAEASGKANPSCAKNNNCRTSLALAVQIRQEIERAEASLAKSQAVATVESAYKAPAWLLPACMDLLAFLFIWGAFSGPWITRESTEKQGQIVQAFSKWLRANWGKTESAVKN